MSQLEDRHKVDIKLDHFLAKKNSKLISPHPERNRKLPNGKIAECCCGMTYIHPKGIPMADTILYGP